MPVFFTFFAILLALPVLFPQTDLFLSGLFFRAGEGFFFPIMPDFWRCRVWRFMARGFWQRRF